MQLKYLKPTLLLSLLFICSQLFAQQKSGKVMESFEQAIPEGFKATGEISLDSKRMKYGDTSLKWEWKGNDQIIFDTPIAYHKQSFVTDLEKLADGHGGSADNPVLEPPCYNK